MSTEAICAELHDVVSALERHAFPPAVTLPANGVYFVFERGERAHGKDRIVRVGSHTGRGNLAARLAEHVTHNKDRSIFRKNIGRALLNRAHDPFLQSWNLDLTSRANRERYSASVDFEQQGRVETDVTAHITAQMSVVVVGFADAVEACSLERLCIGTLSACALCKPSPAWLGSFSPDARIRESGLWQVQHLHEAGLDSEDLAALRRTTADVRRGHRVQ
jgi:hypothetical protein